MLKFFITMMLIISASFSYTIGERIDMSISEKFTMEKDKIYVINFFASWCGSCKKELPLINQLHKDISIIGVNIDKDRVKGENFVKNLSLKFKVYYDNDNTIVEKFDPIGVPAIYFIKNNHVIDYKFGAINQIDQFIIKTIKERE